MYPSLPPPGMVPASWGRHMGPPPGQQQQQAAEHALSSADSVVNAPLTFHGAGPPMQWGAGFSPLPIGAPTKGYEPHKPMPSLPHMPAAPPAAAAAAAAASALPGSPHGARQRKAGGEAVPPMVSQQQQRQQQHTGVMASIQMAQQAMPNHHQAFPMPGKPRHMVKEMVVTPFAPNKRP